jgi:hypothetical protein
MPNYETRIARLELDSSVGDHKMILVFLEPGEDETTKVAAARRKRGLAENDSCRIVVVRWLASDRNGCAATAR